ncbi:MAG: DUF1559 domain-containing protein, partial [Gemmataceae bacterium]|nr:DUF1559 domain-containing protein [Gemmataceae bacterium]
DWGRFANNTVTTNAADITPRWPPRPADSFMDNNGMYYLFSILRPRRAASVTDGLSNTLAIGEVVFNQNYATYSITYSWAHAVACCNTAAIPINWTNPRSTTSVPWDEHMWGFNSQHPGGAVFAMGDGAVKFLSQTIDLTTFRQLATIAGGESVQAP